MSIANTRVHICFGPIEKDYNQLKKYALKPAGEEFDWWNVTKPARAGDMVIFYIRDPLQEFVASATIARMGDCPDEKSKYANDPCAFLRDIKLFPKKVTRAQARQHFPEWQYLNRPTKACFPNKSTSADLVDRFLALLEVGNPMPIRFAEASDIEGLRVEASTVTLTRSRHLRDLAFNKANGICCVCNRDFTKVLEGRGVNLTPNS